MSFSTGKHDGSIVIDVGPQLVTADRRELRTVLLAELERGERRFRLDFSRTGYVDSSGLGVLVSLWKLVRERGGELRLANLNDDIALLFRLTKLDALFRLDDGEGPAGGGVPAPVHPPSRAGGAEQSMREGEVGGR